VVAAPPAAQPPTAPSAALTSTPTPPAPPESAASPASGEELIDDLFEAMSGLDFCDSSLDAAGFTLKLAMEKLDCAAGVVHLYDIDQRELVVVEVSGPEVDVLRRMRTPDADPLAADAMRTPGTLLVRDAASDARLSGQRWALLRAAVEAPITSIACARVTQEGRLLGLIELCNLAGSGHPGGFAAGDEHALTYIANRFTEFVAAHGVVLDA
jgi:GAF domain-containing protein